MTSGLAVASTSVHVLWPSVAIRNIWTGNSPLPKDLSEEEVSWIVMSLFLGTILGAMISSLMLQKFGRKNSLVILTTPLFLLWFPVAFTKSVTWLCVARGAAGIAISAIIIVVTLYNSEIADKGIRGRLGTTLNGFSLFGELLVTCTGPFLTYQVFAVMNCILPLISVVLVYFIPESPYYLMQLGKKREAEAHLKRLMSNRNRVTGINTCINNIEDVSEIEAKNDSSFLGFLTGHLYRKSLLIVIVIKFLQQLSGSSAFGGFTDKVFESTQSTISQEGWEIILATIPLIGVLLCGIFVDKIGRKPLLIISLVGSAITLIIEGACCMIGEHFQKDISYISWLATSSLGVYLVMRALGIGTLPYVLMGELFATNIRHHAVAFCGTINAVTGFIMLKYFGEVSNVNALFVAFWVFAVICIFGSLFVYFIVPETKCKTFAEIQIELKGGSERTFSRARPV